MSWSKIHVYRLDPVGFDEAIWRASNIQRSIRVAAATAARARQLAADATRTDGSKAGMNLKSPWLSEILTRCTMESDSTDLAVGTVLPADAPMENRCQ